MTRGDGPGIIPAVRRVPLRAPPTKASPLPARALALPRASDFFALTKPRIVLLVMLTAAVGFYMAAPQGVEMVLLVHTLVGTALVAGGSSALNQVAESDVDALMRRTAQRPIPGGRLTRSASAAFAAALGAAGTGYLAVLVNPLTGALAAATLASYVLVYTPLKRRTSLATLVGAVPGALPILGGWTATGSGLSVAAWSLFGIMFLWQLPHFLALAWLYRDDYGRAGLRMLSVGDEDGRQTFPRALVFAAALLPVSLIPTVVGLVGPLYFAGALLLGLWFAATAAVAARRRDIQAARRLFLVSIAYLPGLLGLLALDKALL
ncbi:MAG: heme o synthase [Gemmatimonadota bacterium]|nr:heme o synthase [Gemmatimonadota bacterium]MDH5195655.1 heme o synthase [Gemmatimonadota bacterium]